jgi:hypothetical protein
VMSDADVTLEGFPHDIIHARRLVRRPRELERAALLGWTGLDAASSTKAAFGAIVGAEFAAPVRASATATAAVCVAASISAAV